MTADPASQRGAGAAWTEERGTSDEGRRRLKRAPEASGEERAVILGATGAIGGAVVRRLTGRGLPVLAVARGQADLDELAATCDLVTACPADIGSNDATEIIRSALTGLGGSVRIAVFAAGLPVRGSADSIDPDALAIGANIKVGGLLRLLHAVRDRMGPGSRFVTFAGSLGLEPRAHEAGPVRSTPPCST